MLIGLAGLHTSVPPILLLAASLVLIFCNEGFFKGALIEIDNEELDFSCKMQGGSTSSLLALMSLLPLRTEEVLEVAALMEGIIVAGEPSQSSEDAGANCNTFSGSAS
jgi:hypothetical protein